MSYTTMFLNKNRVVLDIDEAKNTFTLRFIFTDEKDNVVSNHDLYLGNIQDYRKFREFMNAPLESEVQEMGDNNDTYRE